MVDYLAGKKKNPTVGPGMKNLGGPKNAPTVAPLPKGTRDYKGFNIKRDKGGKGFSMSIHKKIKGFEEGADMDQENNIDEAEGIKTVSTKGYSGSKPTKPSNRPGTKGFINFKNKQPASDDDRKVLDYHKGEAAKQGKVVQLRYRCPRSHEGRQTYNPGASQTRGAATGAAIYYKDKSELGGRQRDAARKNRTNEEIDMDKEQAKGGEQAVQEPVTEISDLIVHSIDQKPLDFQQSFYDLMQQHIEDAVHNKKLEIASAFVANTEPVDVDYEDAEPGDDIWDDSKSKEEDDWDGTEYEPDEEDLTPGEPEEA